MGSNPPPSSAAPPLHLVTAPRARPPLWTHNACLCGRPRRPWTPARGARVRTGACAALWRLRPCRLHAPQPLPRCLTLCPGRRRQHDTLVAYRCEARASPRARAAHKRQPCPGSCVGRLLRTGAIAAPVLRPLLRRRPCSNVRLELTPLRQQLSVTLVGPQRRQWRSGGGGTAAAARPCEWVSPPAGKLQSARAPRCSCARRLVTCKPPVYRV